MCAQLAFIARLPLATVAHRALGQHPSGAMASQPGASSGGQQPSSQGSSDDEALMKLAAILAAKRCPECGMFKEPNKELCVLCTAMDRLKDFVMTSEPRQVQRLAADLIDRDLHILETWAPAISPSPPAPPPEVSVVPPKRPASTSPGSATSSGGQPRPPQPSGSVMGGIPLFGDLRILGHAAGSDPNTWPLPEAQDDVAPSNG